MGPFPLSYSFVACFAQMITILFLLKERVFYLRELDVMDCPEEEEVGVEKEHRL